MGNNLALNTIRIVIARLVTKYHFRLAPGVSPHDFERDTKDHFTSLPGELPLCVELRDPVNAA